MVLVNRRSPTPVMVMGMTRVDEVAYITVGVGELRFTNASDGNGELIIEWFGVRDFQSSIMAKICNINFWIENSSVLEVRGFPRCELLGGAFQGPLVFAYFMSRISERERERT